MNNSISRKILLLAALAMPFAMFPPPPTCGPCDPDPPAVQVNLLP